MREPDWSNAKEEDIWKYVAWHLAKNSLKTTLVGGAVASIYSHGLYVSGDIDLVLSTFHVDHRRLAALLSEIGIYKTAIRNMYAHPDCPHVTIEFISAPAYIEYGKPVKPDSIRIGDIEFYIFSPTDCVKDRLEKFVHYRDRMSFDVAVEVALKNMDLIDYDDLKGWAERNGRDSRQAMDEFDEELNRRKSE